MHDGFGSLGEILVVKGEPPEVLQPGEGALHHPANSGREELAVAAASDVPAQGLPAVGRGAELYRDALPGLPAGAGAPDGAALPVDPDPGVLGALVARRLERGGELLPPQPLYLRRPDAKVPAALAGR